jgi:hypothetical protein
MGRGDYLKFGDKRCAAEAGWSPRVITAWRHAFAEGRLALTLLVAGWSPMPNGLKVGIIVAIVIGFTVGFTSPGYRILKTMGFATSLRDD